MRALFPLASLPILALATGLADAQQYGPCRENAYPDKPINSAKSELWTRQFTGRDQGLMNQVSGQWYGEVTANIDGQTMISRQMFLYEANGNFSYQDQTCSVSYPQMPCSSNQGAGLWAALPVQGNAIFIARNFSDLQRANECSGLAVTFGDGAGRVLLDASTGQPVLQRMQ